ncbi:MAG: transcriptional regulator [Coleofasciculaceae cyanobacterium SM2_1_6]|nr:transcriptional regulator [Coleofasciculaceae cyanobacterium SM2_1_6]
MTLTLNKIEYGTLLADIQPKVILTEEENDRALSIVENLLAEENLSPEKEQILRLLVFLIEKFEDEHYQLNAATAHSTLLHLIEERDIKPIDLAPIIGSQDLVSEIISGKISISKDQAQALGDFFHVDPIVFIDS